jgi:hypothetical protein
MSFIINENMKIKKQIGILSIIVIIYLFIVVLMYKNNKQEIAKYKQHTEEVYGNIQYKGKVLGVYKIKRWGRTYGIMCIKLDYANIDSFYKFNKMSCLKIENEIATIPTGSLSDEDDKRVKAILNATYVEVNINNSKQMVFIDSIGNMYSRDYLYYRSSNLIESDLELCD